MTIAKFNIVTAKTVTTTFGFGYVYVSLVLLELKVIVVSKKHNSFQIQFCYRSLLKFYIFFFYKKFQLKTLAVYW